jgi:type IV pilus assembly protein PilM
VARRLIGLDVGTNAVTLAAVTAASQPRLERFGQVALPRDAMREGEVVDDAALAEAVARLREEVDVKRAPVRVGIASPRVIVRQVEMPVMTRDELASALEYQAADLIPIPIDEAVLDFAILGRDASEDGDGEPVMRVLLAAAQHGTILRLVSAIEAGGLPVAAVDLVPLALIRALARRKAEDGAEGIVSFGGGVTSIAVHEAGTPRFVRVLGSAGRELTDAIAADLELPPDTAEALKRQLAGGGSDELVVRARAAVERPLAILLDEVRSSIDYYRNQPGAVRLARVVVTGGASQLPGVADKLAQLVGVPVEPARPRDLLGVGDIGFSPDELPRLDPYLPAAVGLALGGLGTGTVVDLLPRTRRRVHATRSSRPLAVGGAVAAGLLALLAVPTLLARNDLADKQDARDAAIAKNAALQSEIDEKQEAQVAQGQLEALDASLSSLLTTDVSWPRLLDELSKIMPANVWLTSFQGQVTAPAASTATPPAPDPATPDAGATSASTATPAPVPSTVNGTVSFEAVAADYADVVAWLEQVEKLPSLSGLWVSNAARSSEGGQDVVGFSSTARLTDAARSNRLNDLRQGGDSR